MPSQLAQVGINGFGRVGKLFMRAAVQKNMLLPVAINDPLVDVHYMAYSLRYDSVHGTAPFDVQVKNEELFVNGSLVQVFRESDASKIPWGRCGVEVVAETSGTCKHLKQAHSHLHGGARKVVVSDLCEETPTFVVGANHDAYRQQPVISNACSATNCLAPLVKLVHELYGIEEGLATSVHSVTGRQRLVDGLLLPRTHRPAHYRKNDLRAGRSASSIIPTTTIDISQGVSKVLPELAGRLTGLVLHVPVDNVSVMDFTCRLSRPMNSIDDLAGAIDQIDKNPSHALYDGVLGVTREPVVSIDFNHDERSCILDVTSSILLNPHFVKLVAFYDDEWAYAMRLAEMVYIAYHGKPVDRADPTKQGV